MSERTWFYASSEGEEGPVTRDELLDGLAQRLPPDTLVWREGMSDWLPAADVPELAVARRPITPPPLPRTPPPRRPASSPAPSWSATRLSQERPATSTESPTQNPFVLWARCFSPRGRFNRGEYALAYLGFVAVVFVGSFGLGVISALLGLKPDSVDALTGLLALVMLPVGLMVSFGSAIRRLHDIGQTGWLALLLALPCINLAFVIYLLATPTKPEGFEAATTGGVSAPIVVLIAAALAVPTIGIIAAIAIPSLLRARVSANESASIGDTRTVVSAEAAYQAANSGFYGTITCLATPSSCIQGYNGPSFLDPSIAQAGPYTKQGYVRSWHETPAPHASNLGSLDIFCYSSRPAVPNKTGVRSFGGDSSGVIGQSSAVVECCAPVGLTPACPRLQ